MRLKESCELRKVRGKNVLLVFEGASHRALTVNDSFSFLWGMARGKDFSLDDVSLWLTEQYGLEKERADSQARSVVELWRAEGLIQR